MAVQEQLRDLIEREQDRLRVEIPADRQGSALALLRCQNLLPRLSGIEPLPDIITGHRLANLGGNKAFQLVLEASGGETASDQALEIWAERFLRECGWLAEAELVLAHCETGFMRIVETTPGTFDAWIATKREPTSWRERADFDWWANWLVRHHQPELEAANADHDYCRIADIQMEIMAYQFGYPLDATIGGCTVQLYRDVLKWLIAHALQSRDRREEPTPRSEQALVAEIASGLTTVPELVGQAVSGFTLDREGAAYHAAVPGIAAAPLIRVASDQLVWSLHGLMTEPLLFLTRELRRRDAQGYHNAGYLREIVFREDLYALFPDKRFVTSAGRMKLRRTDGDVRTDIDAVIFDRKTGTLGIFELKSQDPFARSTAELARQRDNVLYANRQISGTLDWLKRHGGDDLLSRVDARTAKTFRVQKVYPFVLGRYLAHFSDGATPDRRAAWSTWPQLLRLLNGQPVRATDANPIASLFTRLVNDVPSIHLPDDEHPREIAIGGARLTVYPSYAAFRINNHPEGRA
jgi:hypothetical protein